MVFEETDKGVLLTPMNEQYFKSFAGILKGIGNLKEDIKQMKDEEKILEEKKINLNTKPAKK